MGKEEVGSGEGAAVGGADSRDRLAWLRADVVLPAWVVGLLAGGALLRAALNVLECTR